MRLCIPTHTDEGLQATCSDHFGSAPYFTVVDTESGELTTLPNPSTSHRHGTCHPLGRLEDQRLEAVVCNGIGRGAFARLQKDGITVYQAPSTKVAEIVSAAKAGALQQTRSEEACGGHGHGHGHGHGRAHGQGQGREHRHRHGPGGKDAIEG